MHHFTVNSFHNHTRKSDCSNALMSQKVNVEFLFQDNIPYYISSVTKTGSLTVLTPEVKPRVSAVGLRPHLYFPQAVSYISYHI